VATQVVIRVVTVILVWAGVRGGVNLLGLAATVALCALALYPVIRKLMHGLLPWTICAQPVAIDRPLRSELMKYCATLSVWSVSTLLVNSVGIVMVGRVAFEMTGVYSLAMAAATVLAGLLGAIFSPLVTTAAAMHVQPGRRAELPALLTKSTQICAVCLYILFAAALLLHREVIELWVGTRFVDSLGPLLLILVGAHALRNLGTPYAMMLLATGMHRRALLTGAAEGLFNLVATIILGLRFGVVGIACGTLVGAWWVL
jgi:O-antigen/teichoic acid export membrane protein